MYIMTLIDKIINQNKIDAVLICESSDISYKSAVESAQQTQSKSGITNPGTIHFNQPKDEITKEMIIIYQKEQQDFKNVIKLKNKLKELIRNEADIEITIKDLYDDEIFLALKFWELIKESFKNIWLQ